MKTGFSDDIIQAQLSRICSSGELKYKYRLKQLLDYIVKEQLAGRGNQIKNYSIGLNVFFRDIDFNPELDPIVRIQMGRLRRSLDNYYMNEGKSDDIRFYIPKGSYVPKFISNEVKKIETNNNPVKNNFHSTTGTKPSIIILPFENINKDSELEHFASGFTEELLIELTRYDNYRVIGYRVRNIEYNINGSENLFQNINADFLISGSFRKDPTQVRVCVKLNDLNNGEQIWGKQFMHALDPKKLIQLEEDIAHEAVTIIANEYGIISQKISRESRRKPPKDLETYEAILRYYNYQISHTPETALIAYNALEQAVLKDPECATAIAMLASMYGTQYMLDLPSGNNVLEKTFELTKKAMELEPDNQIVCIENAWLHFVMDEKELFLSEIDRALTLNPNSPFQIGIIGFYLSLYGEWDRGKILLDKALKHNIGCPPWFHGATCLYYYRLKEYKKAYKEALKYNSIGIFWGPMLRIASLGQLDDFSQTESNIRELNALKPDFEAKAHFLISRYVKEDELVEHIIDGLNKAGLKISSKTIKEKTYNYAI